MIPDDPFDLLTDRSLLLRRSSRERPIEIVVHSFDLKCCHFAPPEVVHSECKSFFMNQQPNFMNSSDAGGPTQAISF